MTAIVARRTQEPACVCGRAYSPTMAENTTNTAVERAAIEYVLSYERSQCREARDTRFAGAPADVESDGRTIEVKAFGGSARGNDLWLEPRQIEHALANPATFHVYLVENVRQGDAASFRLIDLSGDRLARMLDQRRERSYFIVPFPTGEYDSAARAELT